MFNMDNDIIKIFISGDFAPINRVSDIIDKKEYVSLYNDMLPYIKECDISITNLECPLVEDGTPIKKTGPNLKAPIKSIEALKYAGFNMVTLANNHMMDYGADGLNSTINVCKENDIEYIGAGQNITEAQVIKYFNIKNKKIAFINCCENEWSTTFGNYPGCNPLNEIDIYNQIKEAKSNSDYVITIIHGGHEMFEYPSPRMKKLYRWFIDLGADTVIGHHTHCFSGFEIYNNKPIVYSLGNFVFDSDLRNSIWNYGASATLTINENRISLELNPYCQCNTKVGVKLLEERDRITWFNNEYSKTIIIQNDVLLYEQFKKFSHKKEKLYRNYLEPKSNRIILAAKNKGILPKRINNDKCLLYTNLIRTESHRDLLLNILQNK